MAALLSYDDLMKAEREIVVGEVTDGTQPE